MAERIPAMQKRALTLAALAPAAVFLLKAPVAAAGRAAWLCPIAALPAGLLLCWMERKSGPLDLGNGVWGKAGALLYLIWGMALLWGSAGRWTAQISAAFGAGGRTWALLGAALVLTLYLTRCPQAFGRTGRLFFPAVAVLLAGAFLLTLPALRMENLLPVSAGELQGVPAGAVWVLSLAGYAVYGAWLPVKRGEKGGAGWCLGACVVLSALLLVLVGVFGPGLPLRMDQPFLYLLSGVGLPGAFRRGEALLSALAVLGDMALFGLLAHGCAALWAGLFKRAAWLPAATGFLLALAEPEMGAEFLAGPIALAGNLVLGLGGPTVFLIRTAFLPKRKEGTFCDGKIPREEDVGGKETGKKSFEENEKKC